MLLCFSCALAGDVPLQGRRYLLNLADILVVGLSENEGVQASRVVHRL